MEPRKNHQLLLHLWRDLAMEGRTSIATGNVIGSNTFDSWVMLSFMLPLAVVTLVLEMLQPAPPAVTCSP